jgi:hypothetical protein
VPDVRIHDFRITDRVLAETDAHAADIVYLGARGSTAYPFVVARRLAGPGGVYIDAIEVVDADGASLGVWERRFELDGESKPRTIINELRDVDFPEPGTYTLQYSIFDDVVANFSFQVLQQDAPAAGIVPGPLDASLSKSTIAWVRVADADTPIGERPRYRDGKDFPIWYGYEDGLIYVLVGSGEQEVPGLTEASNARIIARSKDKRSQVADVECSVSVLPKNDPKWEDIARDTLVGRRLNLRDGDGAVARWKNDCEIVVLSPLPPPGVEEPTEQRFSISPA